MYRKCIYFFNVKLNLYFLTKPGTLKSMPLNFESIYRNILRYLKCSTAFKLGKGAYLEIFIKKRTYLEI